LLSLVITGVLLINTEGKHLPIFRTSRTIMYAQEREKSQLASSLALMKPKVLDQNFDPEVTKR